jgi:hypothetical protein
MKLVELTCAFLNRTVLVDVEDCIRDEKVQGGSVGWKGRIGRSRTPYRSSS